MDDEKRNLRIKVALHLLPLSICLKLVYCLSFFSFLTMTMGAPFSWFPYATFAAALILEWITVDLVKSHNLFEEHEL